MEPIASRHQDEVTKALLKLHARARSLGIPVYRLHSDRERSFTTKSIAKWCESRQIHQTLNAGDKPEANGKGRRGGASVQAPAKAAVAGDWCRPCVLAVCG